MEEVQEPNPAQFPPQPWRQEDLPAVQKAVRQSRDKAQYVRQQRGHSFLLHWLVLGIFTVFIVPLYYTFSPNHYWHL